MSRFSEEKLVMCGWYSEGGDTYCTLYTGSLDIKLKNPRGPISCDRTGKILTIKDGADALIDVGTDKIIIENPIGPYTASEINALIFPPKPSLIERTYNRLSQRLSHIREKLRMVA